MMAGAVMYPVVFVPGTTGTNLINQVTGEKAWLNYDYLLTNGSSPGALKSPITWTGGKQDMDNLKSGDPIWDASLAQLVGGYYGVKQLVEGAGGYLQAYLYDWRRDPSEAIDGFYNKVQDTFKTTGSKVQVISHSMGGLIVLAALNTKTDLKTMVQSVMFLGTPFQGNAWNQWALTMGLPLLQDDQSLSAETLFTWTSLYALFPTNANDRAGSKTGFINKDTGAEILIDMYNATNWVNYKLGLVHRRDLTTAEVTHLTNALAAAKAFRQKLTVTSATGYPPCAVLASNGYMTPKAGLVNANLLDQSVFNETVGEGDDIFLWADTQAPAVLNCKSYNTSVTHQQLAQQQTTLYTAACDLGNCFSGVSAVTVSLLALVALLVLSMVGM
jgi:pimeloyl-ACP methyl ester carboxylesterase